MIRCLLTLLGLAICVSHCFAQSLSRHAVADTCSRPTFFNYYGSADTSTYGSTLCRAADGNLYLGGSQADGNLLFLKLTPAGQLLWSRTFQIASDRAYYLAEIMEDSEGKLVACGSTAGEAAAKSFVLRYDPEQDTMLWVKLLDNPDTTRAQGIVELTPGGNYVLNTYIQHAPYGGEGADLTEINRATGNPIGPVGGVIVSHFFNHETGSKEKFNAMVRHEDALYTVGSYVPPPDDHLAPLGKSRCLTARFDLFMVGNNHPYTEWSHLTHVGVNKDVSVFGRDLLIEHDTLVTLSYGQDSLPITEYNYFFLQKFDLHGTLLWVKRYYIPIAFSESVYDLVATPDGYMIYGHYYNSSFKSGNFILKTDKEGNIQWAKAIDLTIPNEQTDNNIRQNAALVVGNSVFLTGAGGAYPVKDIFLLKINAQGEAGDQCRYLKPLQVVSSPVLNPANITGGGATHFFEPLTTPLQVTTDSVALLTATQCTRCTDTLSDCANLPDLSLRIDSIYCFGGYYGFKYTVCNEGDTANFSNSIYLSYSISNPFIAGNLLGAHGLGSAAWNNGGCASFNDDYLNISFAFPSNIFPDSLFVLLNADLTASFPLSMDSFPGVLPECNYRNNVAVITLPALSLGPDRSICTGDSVVLQNLAPLNIPGLTLTYLWQDSSTNDTYTAHSPGLYWVESTNNCGGKRRDSILITQSLPLLDTVQLSFCPGGFIVINNQTYTQPGTVTINVNCDTLKTYVLTLLTRPVKEQVIEFCPNSSVTIGGITYTQPGTVIDTLAAATGCDTIVTYTLQFLLQPVKNQTIEFCPGSSVTVGGITYTQPGTVTDTLAAATGCDTIATYILQYIPLTASQLTIACPADQTVETAVGSNTAIVNYTAPMGVTDCACDSVAINLSQGLTSGAAFPMGINFICYTAEDQCGSAASCCFTVTVSAPAPADTACDIKTNGCLQYELLNISADAGQNRTYRIRVTNNCASALIYTVLQLPDGVVAVSPADNTTYTAIGGHTYAVRNPNMSPFYSVRFKSLSDSIANGASDIFEYTLPAQAIPVYIHVGARLASQVFYEAYLNVFNCPVEQRANRLAQQRTIQWGVFPNPTNGLLQIALPPATSDRILVLYDALGKQVIQQLVDVANTEINWQLGNLNNGVYYLRLIGNDQVYLVQKVLIQH